VVCLEATKEEDEREEDDTSHHRESAGVVGVGRDDETLIVRVAEGKNSDQRAVKEGSIAHTMIVQLQGENTVHIWQVEIHRVRAISIGLESAANVRIQHLQFHLEARTSVRHPFLSVVLFHLDSVHKIVLDGG